MRQTVGCYPADDDTCLIQTKIPLTICSTAVSEQEALKVLEEAEPQAPYAGSSRLALGEAD